MNTMSIVKYSPLLIRKVEKLIKNSSSKTFKELELGNLLKPLSGGFAKAALFVANGADQDEKLKVCNELVNLISKLNEDGEKIKILADFSETHGAMIIDARNEDDYELLKQD